MEGNSSNNSQTNLIINYLPQTLTDDEFRSLFQTIGSIRSFKVVRHQATGYSYGFGFVDYTNAVDAARAIHTLNGFQLQNKKIKVAYARPSGDTIKNANLYIRGVPSSLSEDDLLKVFSDYGEIIQCRILKDDMTGKNKGVAFILFALKDQAQKAMESLNGQLLPGGSDRLSIKFAEDNTKKLRIPATAGMSIGRVASPSRNIGGGVGPLRQSGLQNKYRYNPITGSFQYNSSGLTVGDGGHILFVYNVGTDTDEKSLWQLFSQYGSIQKVNIMRDAATGQSKGFGFVTMVNYEEAVWAIENLHGFRYAGRPLQVSFKSQKPF